MTKYTANYRILEYLKYKDWTSSVFIERMGSQWGYKDSNLSRRLRELHMAGKLDRRINGKIVEYKHKNARVVEFTPEQLQARQKVLL